MDLASGRRLWSFVGGAHGTIVAELGLHHETVEKALEEREVVRQAEGGMNPEPPLRGHVCGRDRKAALEIEVIRRVG